MSNMDSDRWWLGATDTGRTSLARACLLGYSLRMTTAAASSHIHRLLDEHWTATLNVEPSVWRDAEVVVASHPEPSHRDLVYLIRRRDSCVIVVPQSLVGSTTAACASWPSSAVFDKPFVRTLYGDRVADIHGPLWLGYATPESFRRRDGRGSRPLEGDTDRAAVRALLGMVHEDECVDAGFDVEARREFGCFVDGELICAGALTPFRGVPASVGVLVHPARRGHGYGTAMLSALTEAALRGGATAVQARALTSNRSGLRMARLLGFVEDAMTLEVSLRDLPD